MMPYMPNMQNTKIEIIDEYVISCASIELTTSQLLLL